MRRANPAVKRKAMGLYPAFKDDLPFAVVERVVGANMAASEELLFELLCAEINGDADDGAAASPTSSQEQAQPAPAAPAPAPAPAPSPPGLFGQQSHAVAPAHHLQNYQQQHHRAPPAELSQAELFWDFDNVTPKVLRRQTTGFFSQLLGVLRERFGLRVRDSTAYLTNGRNYGDVPEKLAVLQVSMRLCSQKREAADREMSRDLQRLREGGMRRPVVLVSSDKDFTREVKDLVDAGCAVYVVHNAPINSEHAAALALHATGTLQISSDLPPPAIEQPEAATGKLPDFVTVGGEEIATEKLLRTRALEQHCRLLEDSGSADSIPPLQWCGKLRTDLSHDIVQCKFMHRVPETVPVMDRNVPTAHLVNNKMFMWLVTHHDSRGRWCSNASANHDPLDCGFAHARPGVMVVDHMTYPAEALVDNMAKLYLREHPLRSAAACRNPQAHNAETCRYVHFVTQPSLPSVPPPPAAPAAAGEAPPSFADVVTSTAGAPPSFKDTVARPTTTVTSAAPPPPPASTNRAAAIMVGGTPVSVSRVVLTSVVRTLIDDPARSGKWCYEAHDPHQCPHVHLAEQPDTVLVDGKRYRVEELHRNKALAYLLSHPHFTGTLCRHLNKADHDIDNCNFIHPLHVEPVDPATVTHVMVDGKSTPVSELVDNPGLKYLRETRGACGCMCRHVHNPSHDAMNCNFIHPRDASTVPKVATPQRLADGTHVLVEGTQRPVGDFMMSQGLKYLMANPDKSGKICRFPPGPGHPAAECKFLHPVASGGTAPPPPGRAGFTLPAYR